MPSAWPPAGPWSEGTRVTVGRVAVTGASGQLGRQVAATFSRSGWEVLAADRDHVDITRQRDITKLARWRPDVVVNAAAWTDVDRCARDPDRAVNINGRGAGLVAEMAAKAGAWIVQVSSNEVFDGSASHPYQEGDAPNPINPYGASKLEGELAVAAANPRHLIIRTAWVFGPGGNCFPRKILDAARSRDAEGIPLRVVSDEMGNPTWAPDLAAGIRGATSLVLGGRIGSGVLHLAGEPPASRFQWAKAILAAGALATELLPIATREYPRPSPAPRRAILATDRARSLGIPASDWRAATARFVPELLDGIGN